MLECCGGSLLFTYQQEDDAHRDEPVYVEVDAKFADRALSYRIRATDTVEEDLSAVICRLERIEENVRWAKPLRADDLEMRTYSALGITLGVRQISRFGCELELIFMTPGVAPGPSLHVVNGVASRFIDDFVENLMDGVDPSRHPSNRSDPQADAGRTAPVRHAPAHLYVDERGF